MQPVNDGLTNDEIATYIHLAKAKNDIDLTINDVRDRESRIPKYNQFVRDSIKDAIITQQTPNTVALDSTTFSWKDETLYNDVNPLDRIIRSRLVVATESHRDYLVGDFFISEIKLSIASFLTNISNDQSGSLDLNGALRLEYIPEEKDLMLYTGPTGLDISFIGVGIQGIVDWLEHFNYYINQNSKQL